MDSSLLQFVEVARWPALALLGTGLLLGVVYGLENRRGARAWCREKFRLRERRVPLDVASLVPPAVPDESNFAMIPLLQPLFDYHRQNGEARWRDPEAFRRAMRLLDFREYQGNQPVPDGESWGAWDHGKPIDLARWQSYVRSPPGELGPAIPPEILQRHGLVAQARPSRRRAPGFGLPPDSGRPGQDLLRALSLFDVELEALALGARRPQARFPIHYHERPFDVALPHLTPVRQFASVLALRASARLAEREVDGAFADLETLMRVAESLRGEPIGLSQSLRVRVWCRALQVFWEGQVRHAWRERHLEVVVDRFPRIDLLEGFRRALAFERIMVVTVVGDLVQSFAQRRAFAERFIQSPPTSEGGSPSRTHPLWPYLALAPRGWLLSSLAATSRRLDEIADPAPEALPEPRSISDGLRLRLHAFWFQKGHESLLVVRRSLCRACAGLRLASVAAGLEREFRRTGQYPETLDLAAIRELGSTFGDGVNGAGMSYRRLSPDRFALGWAPGRGPDQPPASGTVGGSREARKLGDPLWAWPRLESCDGDRPA